jgi:hypothetical protein
MTNVNKIVSMAVFLIYVLPRSVPAQSLDLEYSTFLAGAGEDHGEGVAVDSANHAYVVGYTYSRGFPTVNPYQASKLGDTDIFVTKFSSSGSALLYSTYLGGSSYDEGVAIAVDSYQWAYITGNTQSNDFPLLQPFQASYVGGPRDIFISKLSSLGSALIYSSYLGGCCPDYGCGIALDAERQAHVVGYTSSDDFPVLNAYQANLKICDDSWTDTVIVKVAYFGSSLIYSTYLGGYGDDMGADIGLDEAGRCYVTGITASHDFPVSAAYQPGYGGGWTDAFVALFESSGTSLIYSTYLGGAEEDRAQGIAVSPDGRAYVTGYSVSTDFPTANAYQASYAGGYQYDAFVSELATSGSALIFSTYLGGTAYDYGRDVALGSGGDVYVTGETSSEDFPAIAAYQYYQPYDESGWNVFVSRFASGGSRLVYSTYVGEMREEWGRGIAVDSEGRAYVTGYTDDEFFPVKNPYQANLTGSRAAFLFRLKYFPDVEYCVIDSGDYDGDGTSDVALFRPSLSLWAVKDFTRVYLGSHGDIPACGDYDGDGTSDFTLFRPSSSMWTVRGLTRFYLGGSSDFPVPGDYKGDGTCRAGLFRPSSGLWAVRNLTRFYFGQTGDIPVPGYYDAGRVKLPGLFRPASGMWAVWGSTRFYFGGSADTPAVGGFRRGSVADAAVFRKSAGLWAIRDWTRIYFGSSIDRPVPADYDGDGREDCAVFRSASGLWGFRDLSRFYFGQPGDIPVSGPLCNPVTPTPTPIPSATPVPSPSRTPTPTPITPSPTPSPTATPTATTTPSPTPEGYRTPTPSPSPSSTPFGYRTPTPSPTPSPPDCVVLLDYSTYLGGNRNDEGWAIALDTEGCAYVAGSSFTTWFPGWQDAYQDINAGMADALIAKLSSTGSLLVYATQLGGANTDIARGVALGPDRCAYLAGYTKSPNFPIQNPYQPSLGGTQNAWVSKFSSSGSALLFSTYLGGDGSDTGSAIAVESGGCAYVAGWTSSTQFPLANPYQDGLRGGSDAFVAKLSSSGSRLPYSTFLGGADIENAYGVDIDAMGNAFVAGVTTSGDFPTRNAYQPSNAASYEAFISKISSSGSTLAYSTYLGGSQQEEAHAISVDAAAQAYVTGRTISADFPTLYPCQAENRGSYDIFVSKIASTGEALLYSTYLGGTASEEGWGISVDTEGYAYVTGFSKSSDFPTRAPLQASLSGFQDAFVIRLNRGYPSLLYSTYLGGSRSEYGNGIAAGTGNDAFVGGYTTESIDFPTANSYQPNSSGVYDLFITKFKWICD